MKAFLEAFDEAAMKRRCGRREFVVGPEPLLSFLDQSGANKISEMAGSSGLGNAYDCYDVANAEFTIKKQVKNAQASAVGESAKHQIDIRVRRHTLYSHRRI